MTEPLTFRVLRTADQLESEELLELLEDQHTAPDGLFDQARVDALKAEMLRRMKPRSADGTEAFRMALQEEIDGDLKQAAEQEEDFSRKVERVNGRSRLLTGIQPASVDTINPPRPADLVRAPEPDPPDEVLLQQAKDGIYGPRLARAIACGAMDMQSVKLAISQITRPGRSIEEPPTETPLGA